MKEIAIYTRVSTEGQAKERYPFEKIDGTAVIKQMEEYMDTKYGKKI
ncbi:MAG: hypothetical protein KJ893_01925 [Candidatus Omnitrophica bacterium]|nr:hypothetical protein [Candidatus Omnitrophota bacterium]MBU4478437.1 hypothetical protein [Candidatus Omnitrophota bacterium]MCG2703206.1 hypothetical protein [Candidatus Omnitrophota bacterium]